MDTQDIQKLIEKMLAYMPIDCDAVEITKDTQTGTIVFMVKTKEPELLIGENGETLRAFSHLIRRIADHDPDRDHTPAFSIDVNDYQKKLREQLETKARALAEEVCKLKSRAEMEPMSSYERLIVHGALHDMAHIKTESIGDGRERRVVIQFIG